MNRPAARSAAREMARLRRQYVVRGVVARTGVYAAAVVAALVCLLPFGWGLVATRGHVPRSFPLARLVADTIVVGALVSVITVAFGLPTAFALARLDRPRTIRTGILVCYLVPPGLLFLPLFRFTAGVGPHRSLLSLVVVYPTITVPVAVCLLAGFLRAVPADIEEQAMIDGHSRLGAFVRVVLPLALPGLVAVTVFAFTLTSGEFLYALTLAPAAPRTVLGTGVVAGLDPGNLKALQAVPAVAAIPIAFAVNLVLDRLIGGFTGSRAHRAHGM